VSGMLSVSQGILLLYLSLCILLDCSLTNCCFTRLACLLYLAVTLGNVCLLVLYIGWVVFSTVSRL